MSLWPQGPRVTQSSGSEAPDLLSLQGGPGAWVPGAAARCAAPARAPSSTAVSSALWSLVTH